MEQIESHVFIYEIRPTLANIDIRKSLLYKISNEGHSNLYFIPYIIQLSGGGGRTMRSKILQLNIFINNMDIILIKGIKETDKVNMNQLFSQSLYFTRFKPTRKMAEGR